MDQTKKNADVLVDVESISVNDNAQTTSPVEEQKSPEINARIRRIRQWWYNKYVLSIDHEAVIQHVREEGRLTSRFSFMVTMACAIAILGLLLSSPAVVIGAMLISPLMAPIMSLGFSICLLDIQQMKKAIESVSVGVLLALLVSWMIVTLSPITDATPEIMARTQPNLFDLLIAIFSGLAGGYAVIKRKGETIVGVAIATALMPPLAVVGFGVATSNLAITKGAFMLFMTNLLAISLSVTILARFYGFDQTRSPKRTAFQMSFAVMIFLALSMPLGVALKDIAYQTYVTKVAQNLIKDYFEKDNSRTSVFNIKFSPNKKASIDTVVLTQNYQAKAQDDIQKAITDALGGDINL